MKSLVVNKETLNAVKTIAPADKVLASKALALKLGRTPEAKAISKPSTAEPAKPAQAKREIKAFIIKPVTEQSRYEKRHYMRDFHHEEKAEVVRHATNFGIKSATEACLKEMIALAKSKAKQTTFVTNDLVNAIDSCGPAYGDVIRNSMRKLAKQNLVKVHKHVEGKKVRYKFELLPAALVEPKPAVPVVAPAAEVPKTAVK
jgi:hypothetical protein